MLIPVSHVPVAVIVRAHRIIQGLFFRAILYPALKHEFFVCAPCMVGPQPIGPQPIGPQPIGPQPIGPQPIGPQALGPQPIGPQALGPQAQTVAQPVPCIF